MGKLPAIGNIALATYPTFIAIKQVNQARFGEFFQFMQISLFKGINGRIRLAFAALPYPFISSPKTFKNRRKVSRLTDLPLLVSHSAFAVSKRCRCFFTSATISVSSVCLSILGLQPRPGFIRSPVIPSDLYRFSQLFTLTWLMPTILPTSFESRPSAFNNMVWHRFRRLGLSLFLKSVSNSVRSDSLRIGVLTRPIGTKVQNNINYF